MTRGARPGRTTTQQADASPRKVQGPFSLVPRSLAPAFILHVARLHGAGQICLLCSQPIIGPGYRLHRAELMATHAHRACVAAAVKLLA